MIAITLLAQITLLAYHQLTTWCDFFPFNGVRFTKIAERRAEATVNFILMALPPIGFGFHLEPLIKFGVVYYFILFAIECATWWLPYIFGPSQKWMDVYSRVHARTLRVLPSRGNNPAPNLEHLILMVLTLTAAWTTLQMFSELHSGFTTGLRVGWMIGGLVAGSTAYYMVGRATKPSPIATDT